LTKTEMFLLVGGFLIASGGFILQFLEFSGNVPPYLIPCWPSIVQAVWVGLVVFLASLIIIVIWQRKERIRQSLTKRYYKKLEHKLGKELENVSTTKNLVFPNQPRDKVLYQLASRISSEIVNEPAPKVYLAQPMLDKKDDVYLAGLYLTIPMASAKVLADKMTELSKDMRYRKRYKMLLLP